MSETMRVRVELEHTICFECAVVYALPSTLLRYREHDGRPVFCPSGHKNFFGQPKTKMSPAEREARREKLKRIHAEEQAEARVAEAQAKS